MLSTFRIALIASLLAYAPRVAAQMLGGQVVDSAGHPLSLVALQLIDSAHTTVDTTTADAAGTFYLTARAPGNYFVRLSAPGLEPAFSAAIRLARDAFEQRRIVLAVVPNVPVYVGPQVQQPARPAPGNQSPRYPVRSNMTNREGEVVLEFVVDSTGHPISGTTRVISSSDSLFTEAALHVLPTYRFFPARADGHPVATVVQLPFHFRMPSERCWRGPDSLTGRQPGDRCD